MKTQPSVFNFIALTSSALLVMNSAHAASGTWDTDSAGNWTDITKWLGDADFATGADFTAVLGNFITADRVITLDSAITIGNITASDASHNYTISGANILTLDRTDVTMPTIDVTTSGRTLSISSVIDGSDGLRKTGAGDLTMSGANTFTGDIELNAGRIVIFDNVNEASFFGAASNVLTFTGNSTLYNSNGGVTMTQGLAVNPGVTATLLGAFGESLTTSGALTGSGDLNIAGGSNGWAVTLSSASNTLTGTIWVSSNSGQNTTLAMGSLADGADSTKRLKMGAGGASASFTLQGSSVAPIVWDNRAVELAGTTGAISIINNSSDSARTLTIKPNLAFTAVSSGNKTLTFDGSNTGVNTFAGNITNNGSSTTAITKTGAGTWALGGSNTYSGVTNLAASGTTGRLIFQGSQSLSPNTSLVFAQSSSAVQSVRFLDDGTGTIDFARPISFGGTNTLQNLNIFVGNNNTANLGSSSGTTTDSTIQVGTITFTSTAGDTNTTTINATGANDYRLQTGTITLNNLVSRAAGQTTVTALNPTTANMTVDAITMATGNTGIANDGVPVLRLTGTSADNFVTGVISNASDYLTGQALSLQKQSTSTWTLSGENTFSGSTTVTGGILVLNNSLALQNSALNTTGSTVGSASLGLRAGTGGAGITALTFGGLTGNKNLSTLFTSTTGGYGNVSALTLNPGTGITHAYTAGISDGAAGMSLTKSGLGTQILSGTNTYTGTTIISGGALAISGAGSIANSPLIQINSSTTLDVTAVTGSFTIGAAQTVAGTGTILATGKTVVANGTLSPGNSPGTLTQDGGTLQLGANGNMNWQVVDAAGLAGTGYDTVDLINGALLDLSALSAGSPYNINLWSLSAIGPDANGDTTNFNNTQNYAWTLFSTGTAITGFSTDLFDINIAANNGTSGFSNLLGGGLFTVGLGDGDTDIVLNFTAIPEPATTLLGALGMLLFLRRRR